MNLDPPVIAGVISTNIFVLSYLPMLTKAYRTRDLRSYSLGNILLANTGNVVHSVYVYNLPAGPIWLLHTFYLVTTAMMLCWYVRYEWRPDLSWRRVVRALSSFAPVNKIVVCLDWADYRFPGTVIHEDRSTTVRHEHASEQDFALDQRPSTAA